MIAIQKLKYILVVIFCSFWLSGCIKKVEDLGWGNLDNPMPAPSIISPTLNLQPENTSSKVIRRVGIPACDNYLEYISCTTAGVDTAVAEKIFNEVTGQWASLDTDTLTLRCAQLVKEVQESPQAFANGVECTIPSI